MKTIRVFALVTAFSCGSAAVAAETVTYSYDALGRLVASSASGGPNNGMNTGIAFDAAGNRTTYTVAGGLALRSGSPPEAYVVVPSPARAASQGNAN